MYVPEHFRQTDRRTICDFMERHAFAAVTTVRVVAALDEQGDADGRAVANLMRQTLPDDER